MKNHQNNKNKKNKQKIKKQKTQSQFGVGVVARLPEHTASSAPCSRGDVWDQVLEEAKQRGPVLALDVLGTESVLHCLHLGARSLLAQHS